MRSAAARRICTAAALLFAFTPALVVFGSEARGYTMMLLAALLMFLAVDDALSGRKWRGACWWLAALALFGMLSHMTMAAPVGIAALWFYLERRRQTGPDSAIRDSLRLMGPALAATAAVPAFVFVAASLSPTGMRIGGYEPFALSHYTAALDDLALWSAGFASPWPWVVPVFLGGLALFIALRPPEWLGARARLYALLILTVPVGLGAARAGNTEFARYYLASALGLLLLMSEWLGTGFSGKASARAGAVAVAATLLAVSAYRDSLLIAANRGHPAVPVADMAKLQPAGARVAFEGPRLKAVVAVAAERSGYRARFAGGCAPADFLLAPQSRWKAAPSSVVRCGVAMQEIDSSTTIPLTGDSWVLYRAKRLQSLEAADSGPAPGARNRRLSGRAGVAQG